MMTFKKLIATYKGETKVMYDGKDFHHFDWLHSLLGERYMNVNDDLMDGISQYIPGTWNSDHTEWSWGMFINDEYIEFTFTPAD